MTVKSILSMVEVLTAIIGIVILEAIALSKGINGAIFALTIALIAGIAGYKFSICQYGKGNDDLDELPEELME